MTSPPYDPLTVTAWRTGGRFPPRNQLPSDIEIPKLQALGTTWYERGFWYWCRRVGAVFLLGITIAIYVAIIYGVVTAAGPPGSPGFLAALIGEIVFSIVTCVIGLRHAWKAGKTGKTTRGDSRTNATGIGAGLVAFWTGGIGTIFLVAGAVLTAGYVVAAFFVWFFPMLPPEQYARRQLARQLRHRQWDIDRRRPYREARRRREQHRRRNKRLAERDTNQTMS